MICQATRIYQGLQVCLYRVLDPCDPSQVQEDNLQLSHLYSLLVRLKVEESGLSTLAPERVGSVSLVTIHNIGPSGPRQNPHNAVIGVDVSPADPP